MKKTKIVTSLGPASDSVEVFTEMVKEGANIARINFSHATMESREKILNTVKTVSNNLKVPVGILYDTKGPEFRSGVAQENGINLVQGNTIKIVKENVVGNEERFTVNHKKAIDKIEIGQKILLENGLMEIKVIDKDNESLTCEIVKGGLLLSKKSMSAPGVDLEIPFISEVDKEDIIYACHHDGDFLAASFVQSKEDVLAIREILKQENREDMKIISKIESQTGLDNLEEIIKVSDGVMVARGDLGVEVPISDLPIYQKKIVKLCRQYKKTCIVATEMLESMKNSPRPTRAEVTDVANAVYNGTDAVMLSGETTVGKYPIETVKCMADICKSIENSIDYVNIFAEKLVYNGTDAIVKAVAESANSLNAKLIVVPTISGQSARLLSNLEPKCPILALVSDDKVAESLTLNYGVYAKKVDFWKSMDEIFEKSVEEAEKFIDLKTGDNIIITGGFNINNKKTKVVPTNLMKIETIN